MASIVTPNFDYTYPGNLNTDFLYRPTIGVPDLSSIFTIRQNIKYKEQLHIVQSVSKIVKKYDQCAREFTSNTQITNRTIEVTDLNFNLEQCVDDFEQTVLLELENLGIERNNVLGTDIERAINQIVADAATGS